MAVKAKKAAARSVVEKTVDQAEAVATEQVENAAAVLFKGYDDIAALSQGNLEAVVKANTLLAKGAEAISKELMGYAQSSFEQAALAARALFGAKTLQDLIALNNDFAKTSVDNFLANSAKLSDMTVRVANEAIEPLSARVSVTIGKLAKPLAA